LLSIKNISFSITNLFFLFFFQSDLVGQSFFDLVHPKDVTIVKDQLSCFDTVPRERNAEKTIPLPKQVEETKQVLVSFDKKTPGDSTT
jgi:hypothetical protein